MRLMRVGCLEVVKEKEGYKAARSAFIFAL
ncbi:unknown [Eggerthella sp. CAG:368]|nr:unknown [Eggerthella sp. CAG:368]